MDDSARTIENLLYTYAERIDTGDLTGVAELFAHGRIKASQRGAGEVVFAGKEQVLALYRSTVQIFADGTPRTRHVTTNAIIEVDESTGRASSRSYYTVFQQTEDLPLQAIICGRYHDTFHRLDGVWWFDTRVMLVDSIGDLSQHLQYPLA